jgi:hypothetical protein
LTGNQLTNFAFLVSFPNLTSLSFGLTGVRDLRLPGTLDHLTELELGSVSLTNLDFLKQTPALTTLVLRDVSVRSLVFPSGAPHLEQINCGGCGTTCLIIAPDMIGPLSVSADVGSALTVVAPETVRIGGSWDRTPTRVFTYPPTPTLSLRKDGATEFELTLKAYPGVYSVEASEDLDAWIATALLTNVLGQASAPITLPEASSSQFYRIALPYARSLVLDPPLQQPEQDKELH